VTYWGRRRKGIWQNGKKLMRKDKNSSWEGRQWIVVKEDGK
jgi:hypothetical protein